MSPERLNPDLSGPEGGRPTKESDCYAFGMVILEVLSGEVPFRRYNGLALVGKVTQGDRPERPEGPEGAQFTDDIWGTLEQCWSFQPEDRPTVKAVLKCLQRDPGARKPGASPLHLPAPVLLHQEGDDYSGPGRLKGKEIEAQVDTAGSSQVCLVYLVP